MWTEIYQGDGLKVSISRDEHGNLVSRWEFDREDARGIVTLSESVFGVDVHVDGIEGAVALIDLYHPASPNEYFDDPYPQIVIDNGDDGDPVAFAKFTPEGTRVLFENGVKSRVHPKRGLEYGYFE